MKLSDSPDAHDPWAATRAQSAPADVKAPRLRARTWLRMIGLGLVGAMSLTACAAPFASPAPTPTVTPFPTATPTPAPTVTPTPSVDQSSVAIVRIIAGAALNGPAGVAVDSSGNVYFADTGNDRIAKFSPSGQFETEYGAMIGDAPGEFKEPKGVAVDAVGNIYVADTGHNRIQKIGPSGNPVAVWDLSGQSSSLNRPTALALDTKGNLYVANTGSSQILKLSPRGEVLNTWGHEGTEIGALKDPSGVAVDGQGNVYVGDTGNGRVQKYGPGGKPLASWNTGTQGGMTSPSSVAVGRDGTVYVADSEYPWIDKLSSSGYPEATYYLGGGSVGDSGITASHGGAVGLSLDAAGNIYDTFNRGAYDALPNLGFKLSPSAKKLVQYGVNQDAQPGQEAPGVLSGPLAVDGHDDLYVADTGNARVEKFSHDGKLIWASSVSGNMTMPGEGPAGIALGPDGAIYVADNPESVVVKLSSTGTRLDSWNPSGKGSSVESLPPRSIAVDTHGNVYTTPDQVNTGEIFVTTAYGKPLAVWGRVGQGEGEFNGTGGIAVDANGNVYVSDTGNHRIQKLSPTGLYQQQWTNLDQPLGSFATPSGMAIGKDGNVYVTDIGLNAIIELSPGGKLLRYWRTSTSGSSTGSPATVLSVVSSAPSTLAVDQKGNIYFPDGSRIDEILVSRTRS